MGVRNCQELGLNLQKICSRLLANDNLVKLLYYTDLDPLVQPNLSEEQKQKIFGDLINIVPNVSARQDSRSTIAIYVPRATGLTSNPEFKTVIISIQVLVPFTQWIIKDTNLRPFAIMGEIQNSLRDKTVNGLGKIKGGDFDLIDLTQELSVYNMNFTIVEYD